MIVNVTNGIASFCTPFDQKYNLIQKFRNVELMELIQYNQPIDFKESGLVVKDKNNY